MWTAQCHHRGKSKERPQDRYLVGQEQPDINAKGKKGRLSAGPSYVAQDVLKPKVSFVPKMSLPCPHGSWYSESMVTSLQRLGWPQLDPLRYSPGKCHSVETEWAWGTEFGLRRGWRVLWCTCARARESWQCQEDWRTSQRWAGNVNGLSKPKDWRNSLPCSFYQVLSPTPLIITLITLNL